MRRLLLSLLILLTQTGCREKWSFAAFGDAGPPDAEGDMPDAFAEIIRQINGNGAELALFTGDLVRGRTANLKTTAGQYERARKALKLLRPRLLIVPGNHDFDGAGGTEEFARCFDPAPWSMTHRGWTFIGLSTEEAGVDGLIVGKQRDWLKERLASRSARNKTVIILHRPVWPTLRPENRYHSLPQPDLHRLFAENGVRAVISGHEHHFHQETLDGVLYVITGGAGADLLPGAASHYVRFQVCGEKLDANCVLLHEGEGPAEKAPAAAVSLH